MIVSSEFLADAPPEDVLRIVADLAPRDVHVVLTLRPLAQILPSQWQQHVCDGNVVAFEDWLDAVFRHPSRRPGASFWRRHRHNALVERWAAVIGSPKVTVIALADGDRGGVLRHAETLLGLEPGLLAPQPGLANRSLTLPEVEAVRAFNTAMTEAGLPRKELDRLVHFGASRYLKGIAGGPGGAGHLAARECPGARPRRSARHRRGHPGVRGARAGRSRRPGGRSPEPADEGPNLGER